MCPCAHIYSSIQHAAYMYCVAQHAGLLHSDPNRALWSLFPPSLIFIFLILSSTQLGDSACWYGNWLINLSGCQRTNSHSNHQASSLFKMLLCDFWWIEVREVLHLCCVDIQLDIMCSHSSCWVQNAMSFYTKSSEVPYQCFNEIITFTYLL